jgi:hypothetical protein
LVEPLAHLFGVTLVVQCEQAVENVAASAITDRESSALRRVLEPVL